MPPSEDDESIHEGDDEDDDGEPRYCYCNEISFGDMVACDNDACPREWFHLSCVGLTKPPGKNGEFSFFFFFFYYYFFFVSGVPVCPWFVYSVFGRLLANSSIYSQMVLQRMQREHEEKSEWEVEESLSNGLQVINGFFFFPFFYCNVFWDDFHAFFLSFGWDSS